jgi:2-oxoglutarate ferredoxin oxidoreductase subunit gamma
MEEKIIVAGFGGQGIILMGKLLAHAGLLEGRTVTCFPSYGPEMRGGTANCMVILSDRKIGSPYVAEPSCTIAMNRPSLDRFEPVTKVNGCIVVNSSMVDREVGRTDVTVATIGASEIAEKLSYVRAANMVALGAFVRAKPLVKISSLIDCMEKTMSTQKEEVRATNERALLSGFESVRVGR